MPPLKLPGSSWSLQGMPMNEMYLCDFAYKTKSQSNVMQMTVDKLIIANFY